MQIAFGFAPLAPLQLLLKRLAPIDRIATRRALSQRRVVGRVIGFIGSKNRFCNPSRLAFRPGQPASGHFGEKIKIGVSPR
jgi:hypothetical protein